MATIYSLETDGVIWYVGSTTDFDRRKYEHTNTETLASKNISMEYPITFRVLEECEIDKRYIRERYYYETLNPLLNIQHPGLTKKEVVYAWNKRNSDKARQMRLEWAKKNAEKVKEAQRKYRAKKKAEQSLIH